MKKYFQLILFAILTISFSALAETKTSVFMISIDKATNKPSEIEASVRALNVIDTNTSQCYAESKVTEYIDYQNLPDTPYYGVALVDVTWSCNESLNAWIERVESLKRYTIYSNSPIDIFPGISGNNSPVQ